MALQLPIFRKRSSVVLPMESGHHLIVIKNRKGERDALTHATVDEWARLRVLVELPGRGKLKKAELNPQTLRRWIGQVGEVVPAGQPVYLEFPGMTDRHHVRRRRGDMPGLAYCFELCRDTSVFAVPVIALGATKTVTALIAEVAAADQHGACLRLDAKAILPSGTTLKAVVGNKLDALNLGPQDIDLVVDFGLVGDDTDLDVADVRLVFDELPNLAGWRSAVFLATSIPPTMGCVPEGTIGQLIRREWEIWIALGAAGRTRRPSYGDYGIQGPKDPAQATGPGMRANIRYTADKVTVVARAQGPVFIGGLEQYADLCAQLISLDAFRGADYSWGDSVIDACAAGTIKPGAQDMWRGAGTSHHLATVREQLDGQLAAVAEAS